MRGMFQRLGLRRTLLVLVPLLAVAVAAWMLFGVWGWFAVLVVGAATMTVRGVLVLRRAQR